MPYGGPDGSGRIEDKPRHTYLSELLVCGQMRQAGGYPSSVEKTMVVNVKTRANDDLSLRHAYEAAWEGEELLETELGS